MFCCVIQTPDFLNTTIKNTGHEDTGPRVACVS